MDVMDEKISCNSDSDPGSDTTTDSNFADCDEYSCDGTERLPYSFSYYGDNLFCILADLDVVSLSVCAGVSKEFRKMAEFIRENTQYLVIDRIHNEIEYTECVLQKCKRIHTVTIRKTTLTADQIKSIIKNCAASILSVRFGGGQPNDGIILCRRSKVEEREKYPFTCKDNFLGFLAETVPKLRDLDLLGCFDAQDFLKFAQNNDVSDLDELNLNCALRYHEWSAADSAALLEGLHMIQSRNRYLIRLRLRKFYGAAEVVLSDPLAEGLDILTLHACGVSAETEEKIREKLVYTDILIDNNHWSTWDCN